MHTAKGTWTSWVWRPLRGSKHGSRRHLAPISGPHTSTSQTVLCAPVKLGMKIQRRPRQTKAHLARLCILGLEARTWGPEIGTISGLFQDNWTPPSTIAVLCAPMKPGMEPTHVRPERQNTQPKSDNLGLRPVRGNNAPSEH